jgi:hypothetical protein
MKDKPFLHGQQLNSNINGRNGQVLALSKQKPAIQREEKVSQPNDQRMPIKNNKRGEIGAYTCRSFCSK